MKVGTDGVLLGAWADAGADARRILDVGTGTGLIALMLAQRTAALPGVRITGVDVDDVSQACENAAASPWAVGVECGRGPVRDDRPGERGARIVANPPYVVDSLTGPDAGRTTARHAVTLRYGELCDAVVRLLAPGGRFAVILPTAEAARFLAECRGRLVLCRRTDVRTTPRREARRALMEFRLFDAVPDPAAPPVCRRDELVVGTGAHECYTEEYRALTRDFYLKF